MFQLVVLGRALAKAGLQEMECKGSILPGYIILIQVWGLDLYKEYTTRGKNDTKIDNTQHMTLYFNGK